MPRRLSETRVTDQALKRTPLHDIHVSLGAKMVPFGGYEMPVTYRGGIAAEHTAVREAVGVFDVSHMGEFEVTGPDRNAFVQRATMLGRCARGRLNTRRFSPSAAPSWTTA